MLALFPDTAEVAGGELSLGGVPVSRLASGHGTPLVVLCAATLRARALAYLEAAPGALVAYSG
jgi:diaminopimelate decarboxylase